MIIIKAPRLFFVVKYISIEPPLYAFRLNNKDTVQYQRLLVCNCGQSDKKLNFIYLQRDVEDESINISLRMEAQCDSEYLDVKLNSDGNTEITKSIFLEKPKPTG